MDPTELAAFLGLVWMLGIVGFILYLMIFGGRPS